jgi:hypothetical protein
MFNSTEGFTSANENHISFSLLKVAAFQEISSSQLLIQVPLYAACPTYYTLLLTVLTISELYNTHNSAIYLKIPTFLVWSVSVICIMFFPYGT